MVFTKPLDVNDLYRSFYCEANKRLTGSFYTNLAKCGSCKHFPCEIINKSTAAATMQSPLMQIAGGQFKRRMQRMHLFSYSDGTIVPAHAGFDPNNPDWEQLRDVNEVLCVNKVLVPQMKLVPKPKDAPAVPKDKAQDDKPAAKAKSSGGKARKKNEAAK